MPHFREEESGVFITIASTAGVRPRPGLTWYNGSKGAAIVTSRSMAAELAPDNIRVNVINPVAGETAMLAEFMGGDTPEMRAKFVATIPLGRLSQPSDIATAAVFFASDEAAFITGRVPRSGRRALRLGDRAGRRAPGPYVFRRSSRTSTSR